MINSDARDEKIVTQYILLYIYKNARLILIACIITYFIGCLWWYFCNHMHRDTELDNDSANDFITYNNLREMDHDQMY